MGSGSVLEAHQKRGNRYLFFDIPKIIYHLIVSKMDPVTIVITMLENNLIPQKLKSSPFVSIIYF